MKKLYIIPLVISIFIATSCQETLVTRQETSEIESVTAAPIPGFFKKRVLIEDYTGTWCGNCAEVLHAIERVYENPDNAAVTVAIHSGNDPFRFLPVQPLHEFIFPNGSVALPEARLNRNIKWIDQSTNIAKPLNLRSNNCGLGLSMNSSLNENNISLNVRVKFAQNYSGLKLVVYLLENKLRFKQNNYTNFFNAVNPLLNFEHNHVLRKSLTNLLGDNISNGTSDGDFFNKNFTLSVPTNIAVANNMSFVAFIVDSNNTVINVRESYINTNQNLEENL